MPIVAAIFLVSAIAGFMILPLIQPNANATGLWDAICSTAGVVKTPTSAAPIEPPFKVSSAVMTPDMWRTLRVASDIDERQNDHRKVRRRGFFGRFGWRGLRVGGLADLKRINADRIPGGARKSSRYRRGRSHAPEDARDRTTASGPKSRRRAMSSL